MAREADILNAMVNGDPYEATPQSRDEEILLSILNNTEYEKTPQSRIEELYLALKEKIAQGGGGSKISIVDDTIAIRSTSTIVVTEGQ